MRVSILAVVVGFRDVYISTVVTMITKLKWIIEMASIDDDKIVSPSRSHSTYISYHQIETIWIFRSFSSDGYDDDESGFRDFSITFFLLLLPPPLFCLCLTAQAVITRCILVIIFLGEWGRISKLGSAISTLDDN